jgi:ParB family chromosome partitioning protein
MPEESDDTQQQKTRRSLRVLADEGRELGEWKPQQAGVREKLIKALKAAAAAVKDWEALDEAVDQEISDWRHLVEWYDKHVLPGQSPGRGGNKSRQDRAVIIREDEVEDITGVAGRKVRRWRELLKDDADDLRDLLRGPSWRKAMLERGSTDQRGASGTGENEWCTPTEYIEMARAVLGVIDLDPASTKAAQTTINATQFFSKQNDGLKQEWHGRIWMNPPYAQPLIAEFCSKLVSERIAGRVTAAISLTHNYTDTSWFHELISVADAICFTRGRVKFYEGDKVAAPTQGQAFAYFGDDVGAFASVFSEIGFVVIPYRVRKI